jgi:hypothetical protein
MATRTNETEALTRIALPLRPEQPPFYVRVATLAHRAAGWYWRPAGVAHPVFLGHNHYVAADALQEARRRVARTR